MGRALKGTLNQRQDFARSVDRLEQVADGVAPDLRTAELLNAPRVCRRLNVSRWTWRRWVKTGLAPAPIAGLPGHPKWRTRDIDHFADGTYRQASGRRTYFSRARQLRDEQAVTR